jgi:hypothetical protein
MAQKGKEVKSVEVTKKLNERLDEVLDILNKMNEYEKRCIRKEMKM